MEKDYNLSRLPDFFQAAEFLEQNLEGLKK